jgi:hypothetical protein
MLDARVVSQARTVEQPQSNAQRKPWESA